VTVADLFCEGNRCSRKKIYPPVSSHW